MHLRIEASSSGPFASAEVRRRYLDGELNGRVMSWCAGERQWISLAKRWPSVRSRRGGVFSLGLSLFAALAIGLAMALPLGLLEQLPFSLQTGPILWGLVLTCVLFALVSLYLKKKAHQNSPSLLSIVFIILVTAGSILALALVGIHYPVLKLRQQAPNATVAFDTSSNLIRIEGPIGPLLPAQIQDILYRHPGVEGIVINSPGGLVSDALVVAKKAGARGLSVRVDGDCASACVAIWAASSHRQMTAVSRIGLHQLRLNLDMPAGYIGEAKIELNQQYDALLSGAGFKGQLIAKKSQTSPGDMYWLVPPELVDAGVTVEIVDSRNVPISLAMAKWLWVENILGKGNPMSGMMVAIRKHAAPLVNDFAASLYLAFRSNNGDAARLAAQSLSSSAKQFALKHASDGAIIRWASSFHGVLERAYAARNISACALLSGRQPPDGGDATKQMELLGFIVKNLTELIDSLDWQKMTVRAPPSRSDYATERRIALRTWSNVMQRGYPAEAKHWSALQECGFSAEYYSGVLQLSSHEAAQVVRLSEAPAK